MINSAVQFFNKKKLEILQDLSESESGIYEEVSFLDDSYIKSRIEYLKNEYNKISKATDISSDVKAKRLIELKIDLAVLASNDLNNIDFCVDLLNNVTTPYKLCLEALLNYKERKYTDAINKFNQYFSCSTYNYLNSLIPKCYGQLLFSCREYAKAIKILSLSLQIKPNDLETHKLIRQAYMLNNQSECANVHAEIIKTLGGAL